MEKMDQTRTDCNLTRMGFPGETPFCRRDTSLAFDFFWLTCLQLNSSPPFV
jgi:hypothetical protein